MDADRAWGALGRTQSRNWSSSRSMSMSRSVSRRVEEVFGGSNATSRRQTINSVEDEEALRWAALERLPTYSRLRTSIIKSIMDTGVHENSNHKVVHKEVDVRNLDDNYRQQLIDKLFRVAEEDNEKFLQKFRNRIDKFVPNNSHSNLFSFQLLLTFLINFSFFLTGGDTKGLCPSIPR